jgi:hypothetical protein
MRSLLLVDGILNPVLRNKIHLLPILIESLTLHVLSRVQRLVLEEGLSQVCLRLKRHEWLGVHLQVELVLTEGVGVIVVLLV